MKVLLAIAVGLTGLLILGLVLRPPQGIPKPGPDPKDLEPIAKAVRGYGFVCDRPDSLHLVGMTERGEQVRLVCNGQTLQYRITMSPDRTWVTIRPWHE